MVTILLTLGLTFVQPNVAISLHGIEDPKMGSDIRAWIDTGSRTVEKFFGKPYSKPFAADVYGSRAGLDAEMKKRWNAPPTEKWMVASGSAPGLLLLSPAVWKTEAIGHDGTNEKEVIEIVTHELTHVYHGQRCPNHEFDGMDKMAWFIEGLATYVAGQLGGRRLTARQAIDAGQMPESLEKAWSGNYRYGVAGSIVQYIDKKFGRPILIRMMSVTDNTAALLLMKINEGSLLRDWRAFVLSQKDEGSGSSSSRP